MSKNPHFAILPGRKKLQKKDKKFLKKSLTTGNTCAIIQSENEKGENKNEKIL